MSRKQKRLKPSSIKKLRDGLVHDVIKPAFDGDGQFVLGQHLRIHNQSTDNRYRPEHIHGTLSLSVMSMADAPLSPWFESLPFKDRVAFSPYFYATWVFTLLTHPQWVVLGHG